MNNSNEPQQTILQKFGQAAVWSLVSNLVVFFFRIAASVALVRLLGAYDYGRYTTAFAIASFLSLACVFGLDEALPRYVPELQAKGNKPAIGRLLRQSLSINLFIWAFLLVSLFLGRRLIAGFYGDEIALYVLIAFALMTLSTLNGSLSQTLVGLYDTRIQALGYFTRSLVYLLTLLFFLRMQWGILGALVALGVADAVTMPLYLRQLNRWGVLASGSTNGGIEMPRLLKYSFSSFIVALMVPIVGRQLEIVLLGYFSTPVEVAYYSVAFTLPDQILSFFPLIIFGIGVVGLTEAFTKDRNRLVQGADLFYRFLFILIAPLMVGGMLLADKIVLLLYGANMQSAGSLAILFFFVFGFQKLNSPLNLIIRVLEKVWVNIAIRLLIIAINLPLDLILIPTYGAQGAAWAVSIAYIVSTIITFFMVRSFFPQLRVPWGHIGKCFLACSLFLIFLPLRAYLNSLPALLLALAASPFLWLAGIRGLHVIGEEEANAIRRSRLPLTDRLLLILRPHAEA